MPAGSRPVEGRTGSRRVTGRVPGASRPAGSVASIDEIAPLVEDASRAISTAGTKAGRSDTVIPAAEAGAAMSHGDAVVPAAGAKAAVSRRDTVVPAMGAKAAVSHRDAMISTVGR
ncbi:MAG TPA: hypothetical protein VMZ71_13145 [Gemmataceae bacterium]|nr:hypothetical protein [Gemmataceae bacterium]